MTARAWGVGAGAGLVVAVMWLSPLTLRHLGFFRVRQVELVGLRYLAPESVLVTLGLATDQNLFDSKRAVERRVEALPGVVQARLERRLPGTLRVVVVEREAVAFAPGPAGLVALDSAARPLPYDPALTGLDLPIIPRPDTALARTLWQVRVSDSALFREVQSARRMGSDAVVLELGSQELVVRCEPSGDQIRAIGAVRDHLTATGQRVRRLDARFAGRVFARRGGA